MVNDAKRNFDFSKVFNLPKEEEEDNGDVRSKYTYFGYGDHIVNLIKGVDIAYMQSQYLDSYRIAIILFAHVWPTGTKDEKTELENMLEMCKNAANRVVTWQNKKPLYKGRQPVGLADCLHQFYIYMIKMLYEKEYFTKMIKKSTGGAADG